VRVKCPACGHDWAAPYVPTVVTIPAADYAELLDCRRRLAEVEARQRTFERPSRSPISRDPEVAAFLAERFGRLLIRDILAACAANFGKARTPSRSAAHRYWSRLRRARPG
jgi:hypothetical protein